jgi:hypothetical protein
MIFRFLFILHVLQRTFLNFPPFSVFLIIFHVLKCLFLIFRDFHFSCHIPGPTVCISHLSCFSVISSFFKLSSGCFSFSMIIRFLAIFHVLQWTFLNFPPFSVFLATFHILKGVFLFYRDFQFSRHIPGPTVCISHFPRFSVISSFFKSSSGCFSYSMIFSFLTTLHFLQWTFLNFPPFSVFLAIFNVLKFVFLIFRDFHFSCLIPHPRECISHFSCFFNISRHISLPTSVISFSVIFRFLAIFQVLQCAFLIFHNFQ